MAVDVSLVVVTYRSSGVVGRALESFRREARSLGLAAEVVMVDHSESRAELARLERLAPDRLLQRPNRGYAAGLNAGREVARGRVHLLANPDIELTPGALGSLLAALDGGPGIVGPQFVLAGFLFPPAEEQSPVAQGMRWLSGRGLGVWGRYFRRQVRRWRRIWEASAPVDVANLSGALLAVDAETATRLPPMDEAYFLYFEETDWLRRARRAGISLAVVPQARVVHAWGHAARPADQEARYAASRRRFLRLHYGWRGRLAAPLDPGPGPLRPLPLEEASLPERALWLVSPSPLGYPAAGARLSRNEVAGAVTAFAGKGPAFPRLTVIACDPAGEEILGVFSWKSVRGGEQEGGADAESSHLKRPMRLA